MNLQVGPKPYTPCGIPIPIDPFKGTLKGTLITPHEPSEDAESELLAICALSGPEPEICSALSSSREHMS